MSDVLRSRLMNEHELAAKLGLSVNTLRNWRYTFQGPPFRKLGRAVRYSEVDVGQWLDDEQPIWWRDQ